MWHFGSQIQKSAFIYSFQKGVAYGTNLWTHLRLPRLTGQIILHGNQAVSGGSVKL